MNGNNVIVFSTVLKTNINISPDLISPTIDKLSCFITLEYRDDCK